MQSVQRRFGKLLPRQADEAQVAVLLKDFEDADRMLAKVISRVHNLVRICTVVRIYADELTVRSSRPLRLGAMPGETSLGLNNG